MVVVLGLLRRLLVAAVEVSDTSDGIETDIASLEKLLGDLIT